MHCSLLRATGTAARLRCGFARYFEQHTHGCNFWSWPKTWYSERTGATWKGRAGPDWPDCPRKRSRARLSMRAQRKRRALCR
nr:hypothetical protein [Streptomyces sp. WAC00263]